MTDCAKDGTTVNSIEVSALERLPVPIAPTNEQRRIVERIDTLFAEIAEGEAALAEARKGLGLFRRSLLTAAVTGELTRDWRATYKPGKTGTDNVAKLRAKRNDNACEPRPDLIELPKRGSGALYQKQEKSNWGGKERRSIMRAIICDHIYGSRTFSKTGWTCQT